MFKFYSVMVVIFILVPSLLFSEGIWDYAKDGDLNGIENLVDKIGVNINTKDEEGKTALHYAIENDQEIIVEYLCEKKANVNIRDKKGFTPLYYAINAVSINSVNLLLVNGANIDITFEETKYSGSLLDLYLDLSLSLWGEKPVMGKSVKKKYTLWEYTIAKWKDSDNESKFIMANILDLFNNVKKNKKQTKDLDLAIIFNNLENVKLLIKTGKTPSDDSLRYTIHLNRLDISQYFFSNNLIDYQKAIFIALEMNNEDLINYIITNNSNPTFGSIKDNDGNYLIYLLIKNNYIDVAQLMINNGYDIMSLGFRPLTKALYYDDGYSQESKLFLMKLINSRYKIDGFYPGEYNSYAIVYSGGKFGVIDINGQYLINPIFMTNQVVNLLGNKLNNPQRISLLRGNYKINNSLGVFTLLVNGYYEKYGIITIGLLEKGDSQIKIVPFNIERSSDSKIEGKFGYMDRNGSIVLQPQFRTIDNFVNGKAGVIPDNSALQQLIPIVIKDEMKFINTNGVFVQ